MMTLLGSKKNDDVDLYYNDMYGLKKSIHHISLKINGLLSVNDIHKK